ncbi:MAG TPA: flagellar basal-body MS-ring/collar protein FliF [Jatrophihabitans sp.]|nr:flagellar basal-body MS-ring/collar protein FliF [Jatrophihabitans sp.]
MQQKLLAQAKRFWNGFLAFTPGQKAVTVAAVVALIIGGFWFSSWAAKPSYAPLFTNLSPTDASGIIDKLNANKVPYQLAANGTEILVPSKDVYTSRLAMSAAGLPSSTSSSYDLLDKEGITTSEFKQNVDYQRGLEGELANTIKVIDGVQNASVNLAIPQDTVFNDGSSKPTASVLLTLDPGTTLTSSQVKAIVNLVSSSVPGMTADNVSLSDSTGKVYSAAGSGTTGATGDGDQANATNTYQNQTQAAVQKLLDTLVGPGHSSVIVKADLNFDKVHEVSNLPVYVSGVPPIAISQSVESMAPGASGNNGVLGATAPSPTAGGGTGGGSGGSGGYSNKTTVQNNSIGSDTKTIDAAPGSVRSQSVSVAIDQAFAAKLDQNQVKQLVATAAGINVQRGDQLALNFAPFDTSAAQAQAAAAKKAAAAAAAARSQAALMGMLKTGGVVLLVIVVIVLSLIFGRKRKQEEGGDDLDAFLQTLNEGNLPPAPKEIVPPNRDQAIHLARQRDLAEMADSQPQEVARLLRTWLNTKES